MEDTGMLDLYGHKFLVIIVKRATLLFFLVVALFGCMEGEKNKIEQAEYYYFIGEYKNAIKLWESIGDDDPHSLYMVGFMYQNGLGVGSSEAEAIKWYMRALRKGNAEAGVKLYEILVKKGEAENAIHYLRKAAEKGQRRAQILLAEIYWGNGVRDKFYMWIKEAIDQGSITAKVIKEIREADVAGSKLSDDAKIFKKAMAGDAGAYYQYGRIVLFAEGKEKDVQMAANMFQRAANLGHSGALYILGDFYLAGIGVPKNCKMAVRYYRMADEKGNKDAKKQLRDASDYCSED